MKWVEAKGAMVVIYEPTPEERSKIAKSLEKIKKMSRLIIANRYGECPDDVEEKGCTKVPFRRN